MSFDVSTLFREVDKSALRFLNPAVHGIEVNPQIFIFKLLAFSALGSNSLLLDATTGDNVALQAAASSLRTGGDFVDGARQFLAELGFPEGFLAEKMPWDLVHKNSINALSCLIEPDSTSYPDGGCLDAFQKLLVQAKGLL